MIFDYSKRIILKNWKDFLKNFDEDDIIVFDCAGTSSGEFTKSDLRLLFDTSISDLIDDSYILKLTCKEDVLIFNASDFRWWCQDNRADKIFSIKSAKKEIIVNDSDNMTVKICEMKDDIPTNVAEFSGSKKACVQFINQKYYIYVLRARSMDNVKLNINDSGWKTFSSLKEEGIIE